MWLAVVAALTTVAVMYRANQAQIAVLNTEARIIRAESTAPITNSRRLNIGKLQADIDNLLKQYPGTRASVVFYDFTLRKTVHSGSANSYVAASVPKLLTASLWLHQVDEGQRSLNELVQGTPARQLLQSLIELSDNSAWEALDEELTKPALESYAREIGLQQYNFDRNALSAIDAMTVIKKLYNGSLLKDDSRKLLMGFMEKANYRGYIVAALPDSATVYHKVGFLADRVLDVALVENQRLAYGLVVFTETNGAFDLFTAGQLIRQVTKAIQAYYTPAEST